MGCVPWADRYMIRRLTPRNGNDAPMPSGVASKKGVDETDALCTAYITFPSEGTAPPIVRASACASSRGLSPGVAADTKAANADFEGPQKS